MKKAALLLPFLLVFPILVGCVSQSCCETTDPNQQERIADAYALQRVSSLQRSGHDPIVGYKMGLTSEKTQQTFHVDQPLVATLFRSGLSISRSAYQLNNFHDLRLETELGFILRKPITNPITVDELPNYIKSMVPVVELPNFHFINPNNVTAISLISSNVASNQFIVGTPQYFDSGNLNNLQTSLSKNGIIIDQGKATDTMGSQNQALVWMINRLLAIGYPLNKNHLLITGTLGTMMTAEKGQYEARYGTDVSNPNQSTIIAFSIR